MQSGVNSGSARDTAQRHQSRKNATAPFGKREIGTAEVKEELLAAEAEAARAATASTAEQQVLLEAILPIATTGLVTLPVANRG